MRTLIVDNYDSFTFNLAHYVAQVTGHEATVIRNDDPDWRPELLRGFDNVIVSPGPGTPARPGDVGICREIVARCEVPLLGVCLGHQAVALWHGARVDRAPAPHHGRSSPVVHDGTGLFAGLPSPFQAVRYHSLAVTDLPAELVATAWTPDGVLMGLRHRHRPMWGVQFHPESVATEHGHELLANFLRMAPTGPTASTAVRWRGRGHGNTAATEAPVPPASLSDDAPVPCAAGAAGEVDPVSRGALPRRSAMGTAQARGSAAKMVQTRGPATETAEALTPASSDTASHVSEVGAARTAVPGRAGAAAYASVTGTASRNRAMSAAQAPATWAGSPRPTAPAASAPQPPPAARRLKVLTRQLPTRWDAERVFAHLFRRSPHSFWLDSARSDGPGGRFSMMGDASGPLARVATADVWAGTVTVTSREGTRTERGAFLDWLDGDLRSLRTTVPPLPFDFALGWVGGLGYELKAECGGSRAHRSQDPDAAMIFADRAVVFDHLRNTTYLLALAEETAPTSGPGLGPTSGPGLGPAASGSTASCLAAPGSTASRPTAPGPTPCGPAHPAPGTPAPGSPVPDGVGPGTPVPETSTPDDPAHLHAGEAAAHAWLDATAARLAVLAPSEQTSPNGSRLDTSVRPAGPPPEPASRTDGVDLGELRLRHDREAYLGLIAECGRQLAAGETYEVCLTNTIEADARPDPWQCYRRLRRASPAPFGALLTFGEELSVLSTSPERFLRVSADGLVESKPIKGTRPRGAVAAEDAALVADLLTSEKDRAENLMIVDLVRNDLGRCAETGSVTVDELFRVESYATVHQLVSTVRARLRRDRSAVDCVRAAFPGGSMTGAPKIRTMEIIDDLEGGPRGMYAGALGYFSLSGAADLSMVIRTLVLTPGRARYGVGGAIVALSDPADEFEEMAVKAEPLLTLTRAPFPDRAPARRESLPRPHRMTAAGRGRRDVTP